MIYNNTFFSFYIEHNCPHNKMQSTGPKKATKVHVIRSVGSHWRNGHVGECEEDTLNLNALQG